MLTVEEALHRNFLKVAPACTIREGRSLVKNPGTVLLVMDQEQVSGVVFPEKLFIQDLDPNETLGGIISGTIALLPREALKQQVLSYLSSLCSHTLIIMGQKNEVLGLLDLRLLYQELLQRLTIVQARLNAVLETIDDAICIINDQDVVVEWNQRAEELYNIPREKIIGHSIEEFFTNLMVTRIVKDYKAVRSVPHQPCKGTHVLINASPIKNGHQVIGAVSAERDITEIVRLNQKLNHASSQVQELQNQLTRIAAGRNPFASIKGHNQRLMDLINMAKKVAGTNAIVLIRGESGTGKELFARAIHEASPRAEKPFVVVNCAAIPATLFESEVFGYEAGAFTGANKRGKTGVFETANGGTLFLDEVAELPLDLQVKLLRVLQNQVFYRVGGSTPVKIDVRFITATHRNLEEMLQKGQFREDLYYRLNVVTLEVPPLRDRREDIPELVYQFIQEYSQIYDKHITKIEPEVMSLLLTFTWPGNVRELKNVIERMVILTEGNVITEEFIPPVLRKQSGGRVLSSSVGLVSVTEQTERELIERTLKQTNGNRSQTARMLGIPRSTLYYKMHQLGLLPKE
ncbi:sigma-54-dependent Fis family transcriptional regulator [Thermanaerosceptrum fracticalcis]|uniref:Sigma-54-dependent Fis family transcriptional regulator n=1 Tax=Thermanaerosceptrum fracticalcis TaxID=1712410 RepID=A0A7G6E833_THEFR|nr:sigma-54-dependent Fis family transcriptional regulator [Thermanaerosceptrum fracticalcis]